jgi:hypothetical protein
MILIMFQYAIKQDLSEPVRLWRMHHLIPNFYEIVLQVNRK